MTTNPQDVAHRFGPAFDRLGISLESDYGDTLRDACRLRCEDYLYLRGFDCLAVKRMTDREIVVVIIDIAEFMAKRPRFET